MLSGRPVPGALFLCAFLCAFLCCLLGACGRRAPVTAPPAANGLPRADPGYLQWLERQSMLGQAPELAAQVSGTERLWHNSSTARRVPVLLRAEIGRASCRERV